MQTQTQMPMPRQAHTLRRSIRRILQILLLILIRNHMVMVRLTVMDMAMGMLIRMGMNRMCISPKQCIIQQTRNSSIRMSRWYQCPGTKAIIIIRSSININTTNSNINTSMIQTSSRMYPMDIKATTTTTIT